MGAAIAFIVFGLFVLSIFFWPALLRWDTARRRRRDPRYIPPSGLGVFDEIYHPSAFESSQVQELDRQIPAPAPLPGDPHRTGHARRRG
ncbi:MAG TPA: hypothetical protein VGF80_02695 [Galbitalea sp.]|jgi:hypothetical protein